MSIKKVLSILKMNCARAGIIGLITIALGIGLGILVILNLIITIPCPTPRNFNLYLSAYMELASYATVVFIAVIIFVVFNIIFKIVQTAITLTNLNHVQKQQQYNQIHEPQRQHLDRLFAQADGSNYQ